jgi:nucleotide-binding universal stress UspA family protein
MLTLLVPVDGSPGSNRAVNWVIKLYRDVTPVWIHLLHVLTPGDPNAVELVSRHASSYEEQASDESALSSARALLDRAGTLQERGENRLCALVDGRVWAGPFNATES